MGAAGKQVLLLWDVDHTLIENSGVSKAVYARAFQMMTGRAPEVQPGTDGRTDYEIVRNLFTANGAAFTAEDEASYQSALIDAMRAMHPRLMRDGFMLPGVPDVLEAVSQIPGIVQSVLTGNIRPNAEAKLRLLGDYARVLDLDVGGYGSDDVRAPAAGRCRPAEGRTEVRRRVRPVVHGAGRRHRAGCGRRAGGRRADRGVATGVTSQEQLREAGAHVVLPDLADASGFVAIVRDLTGRELEAV